jgi:peptide-methionine (R)-S-oxide reductase
MLRPSGTALQTVEAAIVTEREPPDPGALRRSLTEEQWRVTQEKGTERPFSGRYLHNAERGVYTCVCCGQELFTSDTKFDSGSGWPSFWLPLAGDRVVARTDVSHGMTRQEVTCARCGSHLGHVFDDGPRPSGLRYCVNSASLEFVPGEPRGK